MIDDAEDLVMKMDRLLPASTGPGLFTVTVPRPIEKAEADRIQNHWRAVWARMQLTAPALLILDAGMHLTAVSDATLLDLGFARMPKGEIDDEARNADHDRQLVRVGVEPEGGKGRVS